MIAFVCIWLFLQVMVKICCVWMVSLKMSLYFSVWFILDSLIHLESRLFQSFRWPKFWTIPTSFIRYTSKPIWPFNYDSRTFIFPRPIKNFWPYGRWQCNYWTPRYSRRWLADFSIEFWYPNDRWWWNHGQPDSF